MRTSGNRLINAVPGAARATALFTAILASAAGQAQSPDNTLIEAGGAALTSCADWQPYLYASGTGQAALLEIAVPALSAKELVRAHRRVFDRTSLETWRRGLERRISVPDCQVLEFVEIESGRWVAAASILNRPIDPQNIILSEVDPEQPVPANLDEVYRMLSIAGFPLRGVMLSNGIIIIPSFGEALEVTASMLDGLPSTIQVSWEGSAFTTDFGRPVVGQFLRPTSREVSPRDLGSISYTVPGDEAAQVSVAVAGANIFPTGMDLEFKARTECFLRLWADERGGDRADFRVYPVGGANKPRSLTMDVRWMRRELMSSPTVWERLLVDVAFTGLRTDGTLNVSVETTVYGVEGRYFEFLGRHFGRVPTLNEFDYRISEPSTDLVEYQRDLLTCLVGFWTDGTFRNDCVTGEGGRHAMRRRLVEHQGPFPC